MHCYDRGPKWLQSDLISTLTKPQSTVSSTKYVFLFDIKRKKYCFQQTQFVVCDVACIQSGGRCITNYYKQHLSPFLLVEHTLYCTFIKGRSFLLINLQIMIVMWCNDDARQNFCFRPAPFVRFFDDAKKQVTIFIKNNDSVTISCPFKKAGLRY